jgi:RHS repeat-associated protein
MRSDHLGRRVQKLVYVYASGAWSTEPVLDRRFVWSGPALDTAGTSADRFAVPGLRPDGSVKGALLLMELDGSNNPVRKYTWGLDLAGQSGQVNSLEGAGGIGGLLAVYDLNDTPGDLNDDLKYVYAYDGNGNVVQVLDWAAASAPAAIVAKYEYDPYGKVVASGGDYADVNPFRFSTKYWDDETGLGYWGYRYYSSRMGRWISRDPIAERGGLNLYAYAGENPSNRLDSVGLDTFVGPMRIDPSCTGCTPDTRPNGPCGGPPHGFLWHKTTSSFGCAARDPNFPGLSRFLWRTGGVFYLDPADAACLMEHYADNVENAFQNIAQAADFWARGNLTCGESGQASFDLGKESGGDGADFVAGRARGKYALRIGMFKFYGTIRCSVTTKCVCCSRCRGCMVTAKCHGAVHGLDTYDFHTWVLRDIPGVPYDVRWVYNADFGQTKTICK